MIVDSLMRRPIVAVDEATSASEAAKLMERHGVGCLVVLHGDDARGIVTERDLVRRVLAGQRDPGTTRLADIMSTPIAAVSADASVDDAAALMKRLGVKRLVVLRDAQAYGVISVTDIAYASPDAARAMVEAWVKPRWEG